MGVGSSIFGEKLQFYFNVMVSFSPLDSNQSFRRLMIQTIKKDVQVVEKDAKFELYLCDRPIRKVCMLGTVVDLRLKTARDDSTKGELKVELKSMMKCFQQDFFITRHLYVVIFLLDDGTGVIECWRYLRGGGDEAGAGQQEAELAPQLGDLVTACGVLHLHLG